MSPHCALLRMERLGCFALHCQRESEGERMNADAHILCIRPLVGNDEALVVCVVRNVVCASTHSQSAVAMHVNISNDVQSGTRPSSDIHIISCE
jgi:hypothetical protein